MYIRRKTTSLNFAIISLSMKPNEGERERGAERNIKKTRVEILKKTRVEILKNSIN